MAACPSCAADIAEAAKFCPECGAPQQAADMSRVVRKTVTVLFSDLVGSTAMGERHDPEQVRAVMERYFAAMREVIEAHGGTIEKFIGDAIMAVFGIPVLHEDDALRAVRAAADMRARLADLNAELDAESGLAIQIRTGVNTGEVVTGDGTSGSTLVTGDAVNTAARLEQAAAPGQILLGELTWSLVRHAVQAEPADPISAKGKAQPLSGHRLLDVTGAGRAVRTGTPLLGRDAELEILRREWARIAAERMPGTITVLGAAGVGKSRLVAEFLVELADAATVLRGACLPYGQGITYWPLAEVLRSAAGFGESESAAAARVRLDALLAGEPDAPVLVTRLAEAIGLDPGGSPQAEIFWAVRRTLQAIAGPRPLVVVWDDLQWAEPTFVELVEHLAGQLRGVPLLLLLMARPELLEVRPDWAAATRSSLVGLQPLDASATEALLAALPGGSALPAALRARIAARAEGNPLFMEEMLAMLVDDGRLVHGAAGWQATGDLDAVGVPPTISALLAARIDRLARPERGAAERASVVGRSFETDALAELSPQPERQRLAERLLALARRQIIEPDEQPGLDGGETHRFRHLLIRDAAYAALPKAERATLHESFAGWLERTVGERIGEFAELAAHHLEQAYRYRLELGSRPEMVEDVGRRAATYLTSAAQQAFGRGDIVAATALRSRALALPLERPDRVEVLVQEVRSAVDRGDMAEANRLLHDITELGVLPGERLEQRVVIARAYVALKSAGSSPTSGDIDDVRHAAEVLESLGDAAGVAMALDLYAFAAFFAGDGEAAGSAWRSAADWATRSGDRAEQARVLPAVPATFTYGWTTTSESIALCRDLLDRHPDSPLLESRCLSIMANLYQELDDLHLANELRERSRVILTELGVPWMRVEMAGADFDFEALLGNWEAAGRAALTSYELAKEFGWRLATAASNLFEAMFEQGRIAEAERWLEIAEEDVKDDVADMAAWVRASRALLLAAKGDQAGALEIINEPIPEVFEPSTRAWLHEARARALQILGEVEMALEHFEAAAEIYRRKEAAYSLAKVTERMAYLSARADGV
jgi:class 3 adenylate cyclase/tetratricopeptide (TPR) repeat protein